MAIRIAHKMGITQEKPNPKLSFFETEMRVRLWWQIWFIDARARKSISGHHIPPSAYADIRLPLNVNDSELHPDMVDCPVEHVGATEMLYCLIKYEIGPWSKNSSIAKSVFQTMSPKDLVNTSMAVKDHAIEELERIFEDKYLRHCDPRIPLHSLSLTISRLGICRMRFMAHHPRNRGDRGGQMTLKEGDKVFENCIRLLELDHESRKSSYSQQLLSHMTSIEQPDALIFTLSELRRRTDGDLVSKAWNLVGLLYEGHPGLIEDTTNTFYVAIGDLALKAWEARQRELLRSQPVVRIEDITPSFIKALMSKRRKKIFENPVPQTPQITCGINNIITPMSTEQASNPAVLSQGMTQANRFNTSFPIPMEFDEPLDWAYWNEFLQM